MLQRKPAVTLYLLAVIPDCGFELAQQQHHSPDLAPQSFTSSQTFWLEAIWPQMMASYQLWSIFFIKNSIVGRSVRS